MPFLVWINTVSSEKTHKSEISAARIGAILIMRFETLCLIVTIFEENESHNEKNKQLEINPTAQNNRQNVSLIVIVIKP